MVCEVNDYVCQWSLLGLRRSINGSLSLNKGGYIDKTIVYLSRDPFYNVVRLEPVSDKQEHFLIHNVTVRKKKKKCAGRFTVAGNTGQSLLLKHG